MGTVLKQKMSMLVGLLAAIAMAFVLTPVAAHATPTSPTDVADSTVTINNLIDGDTVEAFLIADADIDASNNLTYTMAANLPSAYDSIDKIKVVASDGNSFHQGSDMQNAASAIAKAFADAGTTAAASATASGTLATLTLGSGYYLVRVTSTSGQTRVYQNMVVDASPWPSASGTYDAHPAQTIDVKKTDVTIKKGVGSEYKESTDKYSVGDMVPFKVETVVPNYPADSKDATFEINDQPTAGLEIDTTSIKINGVAAVSGTDYTITAATNGYTIKFAKAYVLAHPGEAITVTYNAKLTSAAFSHDANDVTGNTATVTFNPNPYTSTTVTPDSKTKVKTYGFVFKKTDPDGNALKGAVFELKVTNKDGSTTTLTSTSDENGYVYFEDLGEGTYTVTETVVPAGFSKVADQTFTLNEASCTQDNPATAVVENNYLVSSVNVVDPKQPALPITGAAGTFALTAGGVALLAVGIVFFLRSRKQEL